MKIELQKKTVLAISVIYPTLCNYWWLQWQQQLSKVELGLLRLWAQFPNQTNCPVVAIQLKCT